MVSNIIYLQCVLCSHSKEGIYILRFLVKNGARHYRNMNIINNAKYKVNVLESFIRCNSNLIYIHKYNLEIALGYRTWIEHGRLLKFLRAFSVSANIYFFKFNNRNTRKRCEKCLKLTIKTSERCQWRRSSVFIFNFEHSSHLFLVFFCWLGTSKC